MRKTLLAAVAALAAAVAVLTPAPAQAFGWSPERCYVSNAGRACVQVYSQAYQNGLTVSNVRVCLRVNVGTGANTTGLRDSRITFNNGATNLNNPTGYGDCRTTPYSSPKNGLNACFHFYTYFVVVPGTDPSGDVHGKILDGSIPGC